MGNCRTIDPSLGWNSIGRPLLDIAGRPSPRSVGLHQLSVHPLALNWFACLGSGCKPLSKEPAFPPPEGDGASSPSASPVGDLNPIVLPTAGVTRQPLAGRAPDLHRRTIAGGSVWAQHPFGPVARLALMTLCGQTFLVLDEHNSSTIPSLSAHSHKQVARVDPGGRALSVANHLSRSVARLSVTEPSSAVHYLEPNCRRRGNPSGNRAAPAPLGIPPVEVHNRRRGCSRCCPVDLGKRSRR